MVADRAQWSARAVLGSALALMKLGGCAFKIGTWDLKCTRCETDSIGRREP